MLLIPILIHENVKFTIYSIKTNSVILNINKMVYETLSTVVRGFLGCEDLPAEVKIMLTFVVFIS